MKNVLLLVCSLGLFGCFEEEPPPKPTPTPRPTKTPVPTATPRYPVTHLKPFLRALDDTYLAEKQKVNAALRMKYPSIRLHDQTTINKLQGIAVTGSIENIIDGNVVVKNGEIKNHIPFASLMAEDRMRVDTPFRNEVAEVLANDATFQKVAAGFDLEKLELEENVDRTKLLKNGYRPYLMEETLKLLEAKESAKAFFYLELLQDDFPEAQWFLGGMYLQGFAVQQDEVRGASLIRSAAEGGYKPARDYLKERSRKKR